MKAQSHPCGYLLYCQKAASRKVAVMSHTEWHKWWDAHFNTGLGYSRLRYGRHQQSARKRGLAWGFVFESWVSWWEKNLGPDWQAKRGCAHGKYVMARKGDVGHYVEKNVECILATQNTRDAVTNGRYVSGVRNHNTKVSDAQVIEIFLSNDTNASAAARYGVHPRHVAAIRCRTVRQKLTDGLERKTRWPVGVFNGNAKFTEGQVAAIYKSRKDAFELAKEYNVTYQAIKAIKRGWSWRHITKNL